MKLIRLGTLALLAVPGVWAQSIAGLWDATLTQNRLQIPFKIEFSGNGSSIQGWFFNGDAKEMSNGGSFENGTLKLNFDGYAAVLNLKLKDGALDGEYVTRTRSTPVHAVRSVEAKASNNEAKASNNEAKASNNEAKASNNEAKASNNEAKASNNEAKASNNEAKASNNEAKASNNEAKASNNEAKASNNEAKASNNEAKASNNEVKAPNIDGVWFLEGVTSSKGEKAWSLIMKQKGADVSGAILRVDGDTGTLTGSYKDGKFVLSHFSGARPALLVITPKDDGTLSLELNGRGGPITAIRPEVARAKGLPEPTDPNQHTGVKDPSKPFAFSFPDLTGKLVSNTDERFRGKVVLIDISGSWCPNCHDEAPFLEEVYEKYHSKGLEIVALSFEEAEELENPTRLKAFIKEYGLTYTVLLCGETNTAKDKLTQAENWDAWPTTFFVGRDGLVKSVHAGFTSPGSGALYQRDRQEFFTTVERLLAENQTSKK